MYIVENSLHLLINLTHAKKITLFLCNIYGRKVLYRVVLFLYLHFSIESSNLKPAAFSHLKKEVTSIFVEEVLLLDKPCVLSSV